MRIPARSDEGGFTLVEVVVAMLIFAMISTGFLYVLTSGLSMSRDTRARVVAANLASQQIDLERARASVFEVKNSTRTVMLNGDTFHVKVKAAWSFNSGASATCQAGTAAGSISYREISVEVTWDNMGSSAPVFSDSAMTPRTKINDPALGTVLVGVIDAAGAGVEDATVTLDPAGAAAVKTDSEGCAYLLKVPPGSYKVTVSKAGFVSELHVSTPSLPVEVSAGGSSQLSFAYDKATRFTTSYGTAGTLPTNLTTSLISSYGTAQNTATSAANPRSIDAYPISSGYSILAGTYAETPESPDTSCLAPDPGAWPADGERVGTRPAPVAGLPGATVAATVPMGTVKLSSPNGSGAYVTAVYVGGGPGDPGCAAAITTPALQTYRFGSVLPAGTATLALPFGTWDLYRGSSAGARTTRITSGISVDSGGSVTDGHVLLDPRAKP